ncbi:MAG: hypothetical protein ACYSUI_15190 [Planctomycetota bacterium]|jgi:hypothetical protein
MTVTPDRGRNEPAPQPVKDWSDLGAVILRAARRATAVEMVEVARELGGAAIHDAGRTVDHRP